MSRKQPGEPKSRPAILVLDMLDDFVNGKLKCDRAQRIVPKIKRLLASGREQNIPIFYCNDEHLPIDLYEMKLWGPHAMKGTNGAKVISELTPSKNDYILPKRTYSAFDGTGLEMALRGLYGGQGADTVVITGLHTNICDRHTAYDAFVRNFNIVVPADGVEAFTEKEHQSGLEYLKKVYGAQIKTVSDVIREFSVPH